jgi:hypothetical protein
MVRQAWVFSELTSVRKAVLGMMAVHRLQDHNAGQAEQLYTTREPLSRLPGCQRQYQSACTNLFSFILVLFYLLFEHDDEDKQDENEHNDCDSAS